MYEMNFKWRNQMIRQIKLSKYILFGYCTIFCFIWTVIFYLIKLEGAGSLISFQFFLSSFASIVLLVVVIQNFKTCKKRKKTGIVKVQKATNSKYIIKVLSGREYFIEEKKLQILDSKKKPEAFSLLRFRNPIYLNTIDIVDANKFSFVLYYELFDSENFPFDTFEKIKKSKVLEFDSLFG